MTMGRIDYKKGYIVIPLNRVLKCIKIFGFVSNIKGLMERTMTKWNVDLIAGNKILVNVLRALRALFLGKTLSPLLLALTLTLFQ